MVVTLSETRWTSRRANAWYDEQPWLVGCNFIPSTAVNQLEMWQEETFDPETISRELGWAASIGFNTTRVYLHDLAWHADPVGFKHRISRYLKIAYGAGIQTAFVLFDDCWNTQPQMGRQPAPLPGVHNSGWVQSPGSTLVLDPEGWHRLERYVTDVVGTFALDGRVLMWDVYNEPGNNELGAKSSSLLKQAFAWARAGGPSQPLTSGVWSTVQEIVELQLAASDVITFHQYNDAVSLERQISELKVHGRPIICTEYMARTRGSRFATHLPIFKRERVGCINWGLVSGKTQTIYPWDSQPGSPEPPLWFHDIFRADGTPFDPAEVALIRELTGRN